MIKLVQSDVFDWLATAERDSVDCVVTSPPYWQQRDYGHDEQIGQEQYLRDYLETMARFAHELHPICKRSATFWMVIGDKFVGGRQLCIPHQLIGMFQPWILIQDVIWHKPNPMPMNVKRRFTPAHEHVLFFVKSVSGYYFKQAVEPATYAGQTRGRKRQCRRGADGKVYNTRNKRDVWTVRPVSTMGHEAPYPEDLIRPCIASGCPPGGTVLDPFMGTGTTGLVAHEFGCNFTGVDLNIAFAEERLRHLL